MIILTDRDKCNTFTDRILASLFLSGIVYICTLTFVCIVGIIYGFLIGQSTFAVSKYIVEIPALLLVLTFIICLTVTVIDQFKRSDKNEIEPDNKKGE